MVRLGIIMSVFLLLSVKFANGQSLISTSASFAEQVAYPQFAGKDLIYYFCGANGEQKGTLRAVSSGVPVTFSWEKYNPATGTFNSFSNETGSSSDLSGLDNGCYRVTFRENGADLIFRAWILNSWEEISSFITESNCESFNLNGGVVGSGFQLNDLSTNQLFTINPGYKYIWTADNVPVSTVQNPVIFNPPAKNSVYRLEVTNRAGCMQSSQVTYESIVAEAKFSWTTDQKLDAQFTNYEAPLVVKFVNESQNGDADKYQWILFKDKAQIDANPASVDSVMEYIYLENPVFTYENSGKYKVKLIAAKQTAEYTCRDTFYLKDYIVVDTSLVKIAPAFTPNGDGINDQLIIKTRSLQSLDFQVFNRWGRIVHHFSKTGYIPEDSELAGWDGKVNGKMATPGVYFYVVDAKGRDGERRRKKGFVQMIW